MKNEDEIRKVISEASDDLYDDIRDAINIYRKRTMDITELEKRTAGVEPEAWIKGIMVPLIYFLSRTTMLIATVNGYDREKYILYLNDVMHRLKGQVIKIYEEEEAEMREQYQKFKKRNQGGSEYEAPL